MFWRWETNVKLLRVYKIILLMNKRIWLSLAHMGGREQDFIKEAFDTNWVVPLGPNVDAFEQSLVEYLHEDRRVVALSAGTAALHLGLILLDVELSLIHI